MLKVMKALSAALILCFLSLPVFASGEQEAAETKGFSIALLDADNSNTWRIQMEDQMQKVIDSYKADGIVSNYIVFSANGDANTQVQQLSQLVSMGVDAVIINPVSANALNPVIDKAVQRDILIFAVDSVIAHPDVITITNDQANWARLHAEWLVKELNGKGNIILFNAIPGVPANDERAAVFSEVLANYPEINVLAEETHSWSVAEARQKTSQLLAAFSDIDGILTQECTPGIIQAFVEAGRELPAAVNSGESIEDLRTWEKYGFNSQMVENPPAVGAHGLMIAVGLLQGKELKDDVMDGNVIRIKQNLVISNATRTEWSEKTADAKNSEYIDSLMTVEQVNELFK